MAIRILRPSVQIVQAIDPEAAVSTIEASGRNCYQSTSNGDPGSFIKKLVKSGHESVLEHCSATARIICTRSAMAQLTRHRLSSFSIESQRYVDYSEELKIIPPDWFVPDFEVYTHATGILNSRGMMLKVEAMNAVKSSSIFYSAIKKSYDTYRELRGLGYKKEECREVLPECTATSIFITANFRQWRHIFRERCVPAAQTEIRMLMQDLLKQFAEKYPSVFFDLTEYLE